MIQKSVFFIGLNDKESLTQITPTYKAKEIITSVFLNYYDGFSVLPCKGVYKMESGEIVRENSFQVIVYFSDSESDLAIVEKLKQALNQESIAVESGLVDSKLL